MFDTFASLLAAVVKKRTDPEELPGLEAMMPESALVRMLNRPDVRTDANLRILGGDVEGTGFWGRLKAFVTDLYYREDHDLVVNTPAMFGGVERAKTVRYWVDTGGRVNHFNYFANADTAGRLVKALADEKAPDFHDVTVPLGAVTEDDYRKRAPIAQPVVFVLPGTMGSTLAVDGNRVWIDRLDLARGGMAQLRVGAPKVRAESLVDSSYRELVRHLAASHEVVPFPYDWRLPLADSAAALRKAIDAKLDALEGTDQPVRILAHSMGGLVVRTMLATADGQATWKRMCAHPGARFVMLGTPNGGSHAIGAMLIGRDPLVKQLALLDLAPQLRRDPGDHRRIRWRAPAASARGNARPVRSGDLATASPARRQGRSRHLRQQAGRSIEVGQRRVERAHERATWPGRAPAATLLRSQPARSRTG